MNPIPPEIQAILAADRAAKAKRKSEIWDEIRPKYEEMAEIQSQIDAIDSFLGGKGQAQVSEQHAQTSPMEQDDAPTGKQSKSAAMRNMLVEWFNNNLDEPPKWPQRLMEILNVEDSALIRSALNDLQKTNDPDMKLLRRPKNDNTYEYHRPEAFKRQGLEPKEIAPKK